jgi:hypothetical protein
MDIDSLLNVVAETPIRDEGGELVHVCWNPPLSLEHIERFERRLGFCLPSSYRSFLLRSDGCVLYQLDLLSASETQLYNRNILAFHNWGNGDFDCLRLRRRAGEAPVFFMNHAPDVLVKVAKSFGEWLERIIDEYRRYGSIGHPRDYRSETRVGVYAHVLQALDGVECELNRD